MPLYSGKWADTLEYFNFAWKRSILLRNRIIDVRVNHFELQICSKTISDSFILFFCEHFLREKKYSVRIFL
jgi:hypothetical protein